MDIIQKATLNYTVDTLISLYIGAKNEGLEHTAAHIRHALTQIYFSPEKTDHTQQVIERTLPEQKKLDIAAPNHQKRWQR